ncbi:hypothetical protein D9611_011543 [Ephemerocybe angulata]|uniref:Uncharacterized protein n=1 Tax=Ephemerocybe angulata TaxID=980116 RepID=A0A8H5ET85_9AGAR|nr:hypothetical protein D9611_011543 [Tulosesus angulatus]
MSSCDFHLYSGASRASGGDHHHLELILDDDEQHHQHVVVDNDHPTPNQHYVDHKHDDKHHLHTHDFDHYDLDDEHHYDLDELDDRCHSATVHKHPYHHDVRDSRRDHLDFSRHILRNRIAECVC